MAQITERYNLNMMPGGVPLIVNVSQSDTGWKSLKFILFNREQYMTIPLGTIALINGKKADGKGFSYQMSVSPEDHSVQIEIQKQMTVAAGLVVCEVSLQNGTSIIGSANFILRVEKSPLDDAVMSDSDMQAVTEALAKINEALTAADTATRKASAAASSATAAKTSETNSKSSADSAAAFAKAAADSATTAASIAGVSEFAYYIADDGLHFKFKEGGLNN